MVFCLCGAGPKTCPHASQNESEQQLELKQKLILALTAYAALGFLSWQTLSDEPINIGSSFHLSLRAVTLVILGLFAFRTLMNFWRRRVEEQNARRQ
jgi:hypothetical protein